MAVELKKENRDLVAMELDKKKWKCGGGGVEGKAIEM